MLLYTYLLYVLAHASGGHLFAPTQKGRVRVPGILNEATDASNTLLHYLLRDPSLILDAAHDRETWYTLPRHSFSCPDLAGLRISPIRP